MEGTVKAKAGRTASVSEWKRAREEMELGGRPGPITDG